MIYAGTFGQLTLWGGKSPIVHQLMHYFLEEKWPDKTHFRWAVSDLMPDDELYLLLVPTAQLLMKQGHTVEMWRAEASGTYENTEPDKHRHVAKLYRDAFRRASADDYFLSIEDDNLPPPYALGQLAQHVRPDIAQIGGVYRIRGSPEYINVSTSLADPWTPPLATDIPCGVFSTPMMGAGYTLYSGAAMRRIPPIECRVTNRHGQAYPAHVAGWDDWVGRHFAGLGYRSISDGSLWIGHATPEVNAYLKSNKLNK